MKHAEYAFVAALPACAVVVLVFCCMWWNWLVRCIAISALVWLLAMSFHVMLGLENAALVYVVAAVFQVLIVLWYFLMAKPARKPEQAEAIEE